MTAEDIEDDDERQDILNGLLDLLESVDVPCCTRFRRDADFRQITPQGAFLDRRPGTDLATEWSTKRPIGRGDRVVLQCGDAFVFVYEGGILRHRSALQNDRRGAQIKRSQ